MRKGKEKKIHAKHERKRDRDREKEREREWIKRKIVLQIENMYIKIILKNAVRIIDIINVCKIL